MTDREKIAEILKAYTKKHNISASSVILEEYADELIANGMIVPPCKVGDKLYCITNLTHSIAETVVIGMWIADGTFSILTIHGVIVDDSLGKTTFLTKEEAERELKKRGKENER